MVATRGAGPAQSSRLRFKEKLSGSNDVLQKKLKSLYEELSQLEQGNVDTASLNTVRKELIGPHIMLHKDKGVKAHAACCMADLLRLYAPDAPYTASELRDMFQFFFRQLSTNFKPESPYYHQYFLLVESLSTVKSIVLVCDLPNSEELISMLFREFFSLVRSGDLGRNVEIYMSDILIAVVDEAHTVPGDTTKSILAQFLPDAPAASRRLAVAVCNQTSDKLQRHVVQYFTDIMLSSTVNKMDDEDEDEESSVDFGALRSAHTLIHSISLSAPALLHNVIPQLETELRTEELSLRSLATSTLGSMFSNPDTGQELVRKYPSCWKIWLQRKADKHPTVRIAWVESAKSFFAGSQDGRDEVEEGISQKFLDPDEKVRAATCKMLGEFDYETLVTSVDLKYLRAAGERAMDKKHVVRREAMHTLGKIWSLAFSESDGQAVAEGGPFSWIPNLILHAISHNIEAKQVAEDVIATYILPLPTKDKLDSEDAWVARLLVVWRSLDERAVTNLLSLTPIKTAHPSIYEYFLQACVDNNGGIIDSDEELVKRRLSQSIQMLSAMNAEPQKAAEDLYAFAKNNDQRQFRLLRTCMDPTIDVKSLAKAQTELIKRVEQAHSSTLNTLTLIIRRASFWIINPSTIRVLLRQIQTRLKDDLGDQDQRDFDTAHHILKYVSKHCPAMLEMQALEFSKLLSEDPLQQENTDDFLTTVCELSLAALAGLAKSSHPAAAKDSEHQRMVSTMDSNVLRLSKIFVKKSHARHAKFAARILAYSRQRDENCSDLVKSIARDLEKVEDHTQLESRVTVLTELSRAVPEAFETKSDVIMEFLLKRILLEPCELDADVEDKDWLETEEVPALCRAKIQALKICRNRCIAQATSPNALDIASPVLKMFLALLQNEGSFSPENPEPKGVASLLRLHVANCILRLSSVEIYQNSIGPYFVDLALTIQDSSGYVRFEFLLKLINGLQQQKLHRNFNIVLFLTAVDPDKSTRDKARTYVTYAMRRQPRESRIANLEMTFIRLLHLLAHHPDFNINNVQELKGFTEYLHFYLDLVSTAENLPLLYHLAMKAKTVRDAESQNFSENLYVLGEIAQEMIKTRSKTHSWPLPSYPGKIKLPSDIFKALASHEVAAKILKTTYTPEALLSWLAGEGGKALPSPNTGKTKSKAPAEQVNSDEDEDEPTTAIPRKRKAKPAKANPELKRKRGRPRKRVQKSDSEDASEAGSVSSAGPHHDDPQNTSTNSHRIKEESPPTSKSDAQGDPEAGMALRTRAKGRRAAVRNREGG